MQVLREKQDEEDKVLEAQEFALRRNLARKEAKEKYTLEKLSAEIEAKEQKMKPVQPKLESFGQIYDIPDLDKAGAVDFLDQYDNTMPIDTNIDNILAEKINLKEVSSLSQRHQNPKCQSCRIE